MCYYTSVIICFIFKIIYLDALRKIEIIIEIKRRVIGIFRVLYDRKIKRGEKATGVMFASKKICMPVKIIVRYERTKNQLDLFLIGQIFLSAGEWILCPVHCNKIECITISNNQVNQTIQSSYNLLWMSHFRVQCSETKKIAQSSDQWLLWFSDGLH